MADVMKLGLILSATDKMSRVVDSAVNKVNAKFERLNRSMDAINHVSNRMFIAGGIAGAGLFKVVESAEATNTANSRLENVFKSMWGDSGAVSKASKSQERFAEKLGLQTGIDANIIKLTQAKLATFSNLSNKTAVMTGIFKRATLASQDLAADGMGSASDIAIQLGKALQDPINNATALKRTGTLNPDDVIKVQTIARVKGLTAAQDFMLKAIERQVGGTAKKTANATDQIREAIRQISSTIGDQFLPMVDKIKDKITNNIEPIKSWIKKNKDLILTITKIGAKILAATAVLRIFTFTANSVIGAIKVFTAMSRVIKLLKIGFNKLLIAQKLSVVWTKIVTGAQWLWNAAITANPIGLIIAGVAGLTIGIIALWKNFAWFRTGVKASWEVIKGFGRILKDFVIDRIKSVISGLGSIGRAIGLLFKGKFKAAGHEALKGLKDISGIVEVQNAVKHTVKLAKSIPGTYSTIYSTEKGAESKSKSMSVVSNTGTLKNVQHNSVSNSPVINYTVHINGGSESSKQDFMKMLNDHKYEMQQFLKQNDRNQQRLSFG